MPFQVLYEIFDTKTTAPVLSTHDRTQASIEFRDLLRRGGDIYRLQQTVMPKGSLTKPEEYLMLVYRVRKLWRQYFDQGRDHDVMMRSLEEEKKLDDWNTRTRRYIDSHTSQQKGAQSESFNFFIIVEGWRKAWKERKNYSKRNDCDQAVLAEISKKCRDFEKQIDKYIKDKLGLI